MAIFDIDEIINDPWAGLRNTDAYVDYVLEEAQRLLDSGELEETSNDLYIGYMMGDLYDPKSQTSFVFDGREFVYLYTPDSFVMRCEEWKNIEICFVSNGKIERWKSC